MDTTFRELNFIVSFNHLCKSEKDDDWNIYIEATNDIPDLENEAIKIKVILHTLDCFLKDEVVSWEHIIKEKRHDPSIPIGELPEQGIKDGRLFLKVKLHRYLKKAQEVWDILRSGCRLKASIGAIAKSPWSGHETVRVAPAVPTTRAETMDARRRSLMARGSTPAALSATG